MERTLANRIQLGVIYLTTQTTPQAVRRLESALENLLATTTSVESPTTPVCLYKLQYEQSLSAREALRTAGDGISTLAFPSPSLNLAFDDGCLGAVQNAWKLVIGEDASDDEYMIFQDREGMADDDDDAYD